MNPMSDQYKPMWKCTYCGSMDVESIESARFDPNNDMVFLEMVESCAGSDWCNACNNETTFDEVEPPDDLWGNSYGDPMYWVPPMDDEYWELRLADTWTFDDEKKYWNNRLGDSNAV